MSTIEGFKKFYDLISNRLSNNAGRSTFYLQVKPTQENFSFETVSCVRAPLPRTISSLLKIPHKKKKLLAAIPPGKLL